MKKRTKISLRTKIYLTIVGLLALTGMLYASNPIPFTGSPLKPRVWPLPRIYFFVSEYCDKNIDGVDCNGESPRCSQQFRGFGPALKNTWLSFQCSPPRPGSPRATFTSQKAIWFLESILC